MASTAAASEVRAINDRENNCVFIREYLGILEVCCEAGCASHGTGLCNRRTSEALLTDQSAHGSNFASVISETPPQSDLSPMPFPSKPLEARPGQIPRFPLSALHHALPAHRANALLFPCFP